MVLVTGCDSLLGRHTVKKLIENKYKVIGYDYYKSKNFPYDIEFIQGKLDNKIDLENICKKADYIIHLMEIKAPKSKGRKFMREINIAGTENLLKAAVKNNVKKFFFLSSYEVYGNKKQIPIRQDDNLKPQSKYAKDKMKSEQIVWSYSQNEGISTTIFRPSLITGKETDNSTILMTLYLAMGFGNSNRLYFTGDGDTRFQLLHPDDAANAFILALKSDKASNKLYNLGSDSVPTQLEQIVRLKDAGKLDCSIKNVSKLKIKILSLFLKPLNIEYLAKEHVTYLLKNVLLDTQRIKDDLKWKAQKNNIEILTEVIEWYQRDKLK